MNTDNNWYQYYILLQYISRNKLQVTAWNSKAAKCGSFSEPYHKIKHAKPSVSLMHNCTCHQQVRFY